MLCFEQFFSCKGGGFLNLVFYFLHIVFWIKCAPVLYRPYSTLFGSNDQYSTLKGSDMTNTEHFVRDQWPIKNTSHVMLFEYGESHDIQLPSRWRTATEQTTNTATEYSFVCIGTTPSAVFVDASGLFGDAKRLRLPRFDGCSMAAPSFVNPPKQKLYIN